MLTEGWELIKSMKPGIIQTIIHKTQNRRFIELDILRGVAIIMMVFLHILWDLDYFGILPLNKSIYRLQFFVPTLFFLLLGICLAVSFNKYHNKPKDVFYSHLMKRGLWIFNLGMVITVITLFAFPDRPILFGVLHCIGLSIILAVPLLRFKQYNLFLAAGIISLGFLFGQFVINNPTILHLAIGLHQSHIHQYTIDYFPLAPWMGVNLLGIALGSWLYADNKRRFRLPDLSQWKAFKAFSWLGQHSLAIYLVHQPVIAGSLMIYLWL
jgi:uncharacterized membrane protein